MTSSDKGRVAIRPVRTEADLAAASRLFRAYADALDVDLGFQDFEAELAALPGKYAPPDGEILLAADGSGTPLGCVALRPLAPPGLCEMKRLYVAPAARGMDLGRRLVAAILEAAAARRYREMRLDTLPSMIAAVQLYEKAGFTAIPAYYDTPLAGTLFFARPIDRSS